MDTRTSVRLVTSLLLLLVAAAGQTDEAHLKPSRSYAAIESYIAGNLKPPHTPALCIKEARGLLEHSEKSCINAFCQRKLIKSLHLFVSLPEVSHQCNLYSAEVLAKNHLKTEYRVLRPTKGYNPVMIVDRVVQHYALEHAKLCKDLLPKMAHSALDRMDETVGKELRYIIKTVLDKKVSDKFGGKPVDEVKFEDRIRLLFDEVTSFGTATDGKQLRKAIKELSQSIKEQEILDLQYRKNSPAWKVKKSDFEAIFDSHVKRPCQVLMNTLGEVYLQAELDYKLYDEWYFPDREEFYDLWSHYRFCKHVTRPGSDDLFNNLIQASLGERFHLDD